MKYIVYFSAIMAMAVFSCTKDRADLPKAPEVAPASVSYCDSMKTAGSVSFKCEVDTIIKTYCALSSCHNNTPDFGSSQPNLTDYNKVSNFKVRIKDRMALTKDMPPSNATLFPADSLRDKVKKWIEQGATNN